MPIGLPHHAHQLALALHLAAAHAGALGNVLRHLDCAKCLLRRVSITSLPRPALRCFLAMTTPCSSSNTSVRSLRLPFFLPPLRSSSSSSSISSISIGPAGAATTASPSARRLLAVRLATATASAGCLFDRRLRHGNGFRGFLFRHDRLCEPAPARSAVPLVRTRHRRSGFGHDRLESQALLVDRLLDVRQALRPDAVDRQHGFVAGWPGVRESGPHWSGRIVRCVPARAG